MARPDTETILESISDGVFTIDMDWRVTSFNRAAEEITGIPREEAKGKLCHEVFKSNMCERDCPLRKTLKTGKAFIDRPAWFLRPDGERVPISVSTARLYREDGSLAGGVETFRDLREIEELKGQLASRDEGSESHSPAMKQILAQIEPIARSGSTVLVRGETGTGKEVLARAIHRASGSGDGPFVAINCAALPESLLESELFGYRRGAFTGAERDKPGLFKRAAGGTIFLDEIGDMPLPLQVKILRVLQEREYDVLGANRPEKTDARVICATHRDLEAMVASGHFRQDLYYRINVIALDLPPLRARSEDIPALARSFLRRYRERSGRHVEGFTPKAFEALWQYPWPGNIRELENAVERAVVLAKGPMIERSDLPPAIRGEESKADSSTRPHSPAAGKPVAGRSPVEGSLDGPETGSRGSGGPESLKTAREAAEIACIEEAIAAAGGNKTRAARALGMDKATLYRKLKRWQDSRR